MSEPRYADVSSGLRHGAAAAELCATCPDDRRCVAPPLMTTDEVQNHIARALMASLATGDSRRLSTVVAVVGDRDTASQLCPVLAARLADPADASGAHAAIRRLMRGDA